MKLILKRFLPQLSVLTVICIMAGIGYIKSEIAVDSAAVSQTKTVIIDAGHGGLTNTIKV